MSVPVILLTWLYLSTTPFPTFPDFNNTNKSIHHSLSPSPSVIFDVFSRLLFYCSSAESSVCSQAAMGQTHFSSPNGILDWAGCRYFLSYRKRTAAGTWPTRAAIFICALFWTCDDWRSAAVMSRVSACICLWGNGTWGRQDFRLKTPLEISFCYCQHILKPYLPFLYIFFYAKRLQGLDSSSGIYQHFCNLNKNQYSF